MKLNQRVKIWRACDDSDYASNCFGAEPQNDWFDIQYYAEQIEAIIIQTKGSLLAQHVYKGMGGKELRGEVYDISKNGIKHRIEEVKERIEYYGIKLEDFFERISSLEDFYTIEVLN